jgi:hypothetical protein
MKTRTRLILLVLIVVLALLLSACKAMTPTTPDTFISTMESFGYTVTDSTDQFESQNETDIEAAYFASNGSIQFAFLFCSSSDQALDMYSSSVESFKDKMTSNNMSTSVNFGNHSKYTLDNGTEYMASSRIEDTVVVVTADNVNKSEIKEVLKALGY